MYIHVYLHIYPQIYIYSYAHNFHSENIYLFQKGTFMIFVTLTEEVGKQASRRRRTKMPPQVTQWYHQRPVTDPLNPEQEQRRANKTHQDEGTLHERKKKKTTRNNNKTGKGKEEDSPICGIEKQSPRDARLLPTFGSAGSMLSVLTLKINFATTCFTLVF